jgi:hypothetical protein
MADDDDNVVPSRKLESDSANGNTKKQKDLERGYRHLIGLRARLDVPGEVHGVWVSRRLDVASPARYSPAQPEPLSHHAFGRVRPRGLLKA